MGILNAFVICRNYQKPVGTAAAAVIIAVITFVICFVVLTLMMKETLRKKEAMEAEPDDADEI